jgi:cardiolipin synthase (CMP-forming)
VKRLLRQAPNILSALRLAAAPLTAWLILHHQDAAALAVFVLAGLSDALDGYLAKGFGLASRFGAWLDPAADKLLMLAAFVTLTWTGKVPLWVTALVIGRDVTIVLGIVLAKAMGSPLAIAPLTVGKASTVVQVIYIVLVLAVSVLHSGRAWVTLLGETAVALLTISSFVAYGGVWLKAVTARRTA